MNNKRHCFVWKLLDLIFGHDCLHKCFQYLFERLVFVAILHKSWHVAATDYLHLRRKVPTDYHIFPTIFISRSTVARDP